MNLLKKLLFIKIFVALFFVNSFAQKDPSSPDNIKKYVQYLASEELEGRLPGTAGIDKAANYISQHFKKVGLKSFRENYFQQFDVRTGIKLGSENKFALTVLVERLGVPVEKWKPATKNINVEEEWLPAAFSENGSVSADLVFAGYGISAEPLGYDDYKDIDVNGKIVIVISGSPDGSTEKSKFVNYLSDRYKATNARNKGAVGVLIVNPQGDSANILKPLSFQMMSRNSGILVAYIKRTLAFSLMPKNVQLNYVENAINKSQKPNSFAVPYTKVSLTIDLVDDYRPTSNVIGYVEGRFNPQEYIVVGAHYDHLGYGQLGNSAYVGKTPKIHPGADDNASGVAGVMELAERFAKNPADRTIVFMAFTGEEMGLLGSTHYVENNFFPHENTFLMLNFDMIGRMKDNKLQIFGLGSSPVLSNVIDSISSIENIGIVKLQDGFGPSDHTPFYKKKIPVMHFFTGAHGDYHKPTDTWEKLDYVASARVVDFAESVVRHFASIQQKPAFTEVVDTTNRPAMRGGGPWFGIVPNFEESPLGLKISGTSPGSPAQAAGLKEDDIITHIDDKQVKNLHDFMYIIGEYKAGNTVKVRVLRNNKEMFFNVTLANRNKQ